MAYTEVSSNDADELLIQAGLSDLNKIVPLDGDRDALFVACLHRNPLRRPSPG